MKPLIVALDVETDKEALGLVRRLRGLVDVFKIGPVLYLRYGGPLIQEVAAAGGRVFLDLKFHDIPSVVARAVERASGWGVYSATVHVSGGAAMMREAAAVSKRPRLWGVTVLTSLEDSDLRAMGVRRTAAAQVGKLAALACESGLDGVIASAREARLVKKACGPAFQVVTPGIRFNPGGDDQKRTQSPRVAVRNGADFFVMGRPVLEADDPVRLIESIYQSIGAPVSPARSGGNA